MDYSEAQTLADLHRLLSEYSRWNVARAIEPACDVEISHLREALAEDASPRDRLKALAGLRRASILVYHLEEDDRKTARRQGVRTLLEFIRHESDDSAMVLSESQIRYLADCIENTPPSGTDAHWEHWIAPDKKLSECITRIGDARGSAVVRPLVEAGEVYSRSTRGDARIDDALRACAEVVEETTALLHLAQYPQFILVPIGTRPTPSIPPLSIPPDDLATYVASIRKLFEKDANARHWSMSEIRREIRSNKQKTLAALRFLRTQREYEGKPGWGEDDHA